MTKYTRITISPEERLALEIAASTLEQYENYIAAARITNLLERSKHKEIKDVK